MVVRLLRCSGMGMDGVMYGYIVSKLRKPKKDFCLSIGMNSSCVWVYNKEEGVNTLLQRLTELSVRQSVTSATRCLKLVVVDT